MAEDSILWTTSGTGDGDSNGYTQAELIRWLRQSFISDSTDEGVLKGYLNELEVTGIATPVSVNTGAAYVYGFPYWNTASVNVAIPTPSVSTRIDYIVLRASWSAQTVRITRIAGNEGGGAPSLTQSDGVTWDVPLATASITTGGVITVTDAREFLHPNIEIEAGMFNADVAGDGLELSSGAIQANVDDSTIEVSGDALRVKAGGLDNSHLADRTRTLFVPATECENVTDGTYENQVWRGWEMIDAKDCVCYGAFRCPPDYASGLSIQAIFESPSAGDARMRLRGYYAANGEAYNTHSTTNTTVDETIVANTLDQMTAAVSLGSIATGDYAILECEREASHANDTVGDVVYFVGFLVSYTADM